MNMLCWLIIHTSNTSGRIATYAKSLRFKINLGETQTVSATAHAGIQQRSHHFVNQEKNTGEKGNPQKSNSAEFMYVRDLSRKTNRRNQIEVQLQHANHYVPNTVPENINISLKTPNSN